MKTLLALIVVIAIAAGAYYYLGQGHREPNLDRVQEQTVRRFGEVKDAVKDQLKDWHLSGPEVKEELERTGKVVRKKAEQVGAVLADKTADARTTAAIKAKLVKDPDLSALSISVNTTDGVVTLSGTVSSPEKVSAAIKLALETEGAREVVSTLQVKP